MDEQMIEWRCFHCGDVFTDRRCAEAHFGPNEDSAPACQIKAGAEGSLVRALRTVEQELADARSDIATESTEAAKAYYSQQTRHYAQLQAAEEAGYERGLADAREEARAAHGVMAGRIAELACAAIEAVQSPFDHHSQCPEDCAFVDALDAAERAVRAALAPKARHE